MLKTNIVLIGMPSSGKTTVGKPLAEAFDMGFIDTDLIIKEKAGKPLRDIVNEDGLEAFLKLQEEMLLELNVENHVISTGGSVIYNDKAMKYLAQDGFIIYLRTSLEELEKRITPDRRFARNNGQSYKDLYNERTPLYQRYAHIVVNCDERNVEDIITEITEKWQEYNEALRCPHL